MITRPMLAAKTPDNLATLRYPVLATPKLDGIRCLKVGGVAVTRTFKQLPNNYIRKLVQDSLPDGVDGEIMEKGKSFCGIASSVMSREGELPNFQYWIFDYVKEGLDRSYVERINEGFHELKWCPFVKVLRPVVCNSVDQLLDFETMCIAFGFEGVVFRTPNSPYKCGRSTIREQFMVKLKRFVDDEAVIIGTEELQRNENEQTADAFGLAERSSHKEGLVGGGTLGALVVRGDKGDFKIGTGFTASLRDSLWNRREELVGKKVTYKHFPFGAKDKPRIPVFKCIREDI